ncbi:anti-sigma factor [Rhodococcus sp. Leaf7]|jgi:mycothiol system anti-sigma-R factor|uniref:mycothiol system anti-sigma-R factor n=1 Tax=unclassified Rhodococcus (in: high G+C Gram-positive bacteria) TaxID=192944 RepID=UPI0005ACDE82|nr:MULTISPECIES: mycothiol system anti-sigma-R factor [unclassified Rhodococcus (in: high G+C Gram-positive bacteria)]KIQ19609.1 anti-sigma factor [Rhodococcus sp. MEB064]KQU06267.1 anti-sigma factor [Rhodococcus sp. Leaf7]KQU41784.1 anti-sigma factor [Rhodococcus sp. Leaf247]
MSGDQFEDLDCSAVIADVWTLLDNECDEASRLRVQHHLDSCGSCLAQYGIEEKIKSMINRKCGGERAPDGLRERLTLEIRRSVTISTED